MYNEVISTYDLTRIDLDIEGPHESEGNEKNAQAIAAVQKSTNVKVDLTLPVTTSGLDGRGTQILKTYHDAGVDIDKVNIMSMLFNSGQTTSEQVNKSIDYTKNQLMSEFSIDEDEAYGMLGVTNSIGKETF